MNPFSSSLRLTYSVNTKLIQKLDPVVGLFEKYFPTEIHGLERVPEGAALFVGNHSAGMTTPDSFIFYRAYMHATNFEDPPVALGHDALFRVPLLREFLTHAGTVPARPEHAMRAFEQGRKVLVYPGGDWECTRPSRMRDRIDFGGRKGFVRVAMRSGVPIVPFVSAGGHDGWYVLTRGEWIARKLKLDKMFRLQIFPIAFALPTGLLIGPVTLHIPLPHPMLMEVLYPIRIDGDPDNPEDVARGYALVTQTMQDALTRLASRLRAQRDENSVAI